MNLTVRPAEVADVPSLLNLVKELALYERAPDEVSNTEERMTKDGFGEQALFKAFVALGGDDIIGMAICYFRYSTWKGKVLYLEDLYVKESKRGVGAGKALFERCIDYGKETDCVRMSWQVLDWNTPSIDFYNKYGTLIENEWLNCSLDLIV